METVVNPEHSIAARASSLRRALLALLQDPPADGDRGIKLDRGALLQVYLAEYHALTMRNTYWITLQYALLPILGAALAVLAQMWGQFDKSPASSTPAHRVMIWVAMVIINVVIFAHAAVGWESYNNVVYLENHLRPRIVALLRSIDDASKNAALGYEKYQKKRRGKGVKSWELLGAIVSVALLAWGIAFFGYFHPWTTVEWVAVPFNAVLLISVILVTFKMVRRRIDIGSCDAL